MSSPATDGPATSVTGSGDAPVAPRVIEDPRSLRRVLLVKLSSLGDIVHALPLAQALREGMPDAHLAWAVKKRFASLLEGNPHLSAVYTLEGSGPGDLLRFGGRLRAERFDTALDAQGLLVSGLVTRLSGAPKRIGMDRNREGNALWMTDAVVPGRDRAHMVAVLLRFCDALGIPRVAPRRQDYLADAEAAQAEALLAEAGAGPRVGLIVGASTADKAWPRERWAELIRTLADQGMKPVLLGSTGEAGTAGGLMQDTGNAPLNLVGRTPLRVLAAVLARCDAVLGGDSGPAHLAVAVGAPVIGLYGVTDPARTGPDWGPARAIVLDYNDDAPPETRRPRHATVADALARIPARAAADAALDLLRKGR